MISFLFERRIIVVYVAFYLTKSIEWFQSYSVFANIPVNIFEFQVIISGEVSGVKNSRISEI